MGYQYKNIEITRLSVIGAGQIGPDICLHFAKVFWRFNVELILIDISDEALSKARAKIEKKVAKGQETGAFSEEMASTMKGSIHCTSDYSFIKNSNIVLEAVTEDEKIKDLIFKQVVDLTDKNCLLLSNSSHMTPEVIFKNVPHKNRCAVTHYFFPAERNPVIEIVSGEETSIETRDFLMEFYEAIGKVPMAVKSSYGYAIDPIFEGLCQLAIICLEKGYGTIKEIDYVARKVLQQGVGPFTALNLTGGNPLTNHGLEEMRETHIQWFRSPKLLQDATANGTLWETAKKGEKVIVDGQKFELLKDQLLGGYFALASYVIDLDITHVNDLNMATEIALVIAPPFTLMNKTGIDKAHYFVKKWCKEHTTFPFPNSMNQAKKQGGWHISRIVSKKEDGIAILTIRRPKVLNALNLEVLKELKAEIINAEQDQSVEGIIITGFGTKAFVSGADINMLASLKTPEEGYTNSHTFQGLINTIEACNKPTVCALNGFAFGGGNELAITCDARVAPKGLRVVACQPEVNLGFIPGAGGTQRLPRLIGIEKAAEMLRTGRPVSSKEAAEIGLIDYEVEGDLMTSAISLAKKLACSNYQDKAKKQTTKPANSVPNEINIGHLSKKIDDIIKKAIYEGIKLPLKDALELESKLFGECILTEDMKIGLDNFITNGPKAKANFIHK